MELNKKLEIIDVICQLNFQPIYLLIVFCEKISYLGSGTYSVVRKARYNNEIVAIKIFNKKKDASGDVEYLKEV